MLINSDSNSTRFDGLALFSGGLDSILAVKVVQAQGLRILGLHFMSPFFGKPHKLEHWRRTYGIEVVPVEVGEEFAAMLRSPVHGMGKVLNPCIDCKILMMRRARSLLAEYGATFIISGEVLGQRPMSQRRDALNVIRRDASVKDVLLRPLSAKHLDPTPMEQSGLIDRARLKDFWGRGRKAQLALAAEFGITDIPTPAGGCLLAELESGRRYWPVLKHFPAPGAAEYDLANIGRQLWKDGHWLVMGRNKADNERLGQLRREGDISIDVIDFPGPLGLVRPIPGHPWTEDLLLSAAAKVASFCPKAINSCAPVQVLVESAGQSRTVTVHPQAALENGWHEPTWELALEEKKEQEKLRRDEASG
jgi:tRNA-uridine 2-sulfurtransferase